MEKPTHRETCKALARLLLHEPWADAVAWEIGVGSSQFDVLALSGQNLSEKGRGPLPRIFVGEVKMSREDLRGGIRRGQLEQYRSNAIRPSHLLLAIWEDALTRYHPAGHFWDDEDTRRALEALKGEGVPDAWGVARVSLGLGRRREVQITVLRRPARLNDGGLLIDRLRLMERIARSFSYRLLSSTSPEMEPA